MKNQFPPDSFSFEFQDILGESFVSLDDDTVYLKSDNDVNVAIEKLSKKYPKYRWFRPDELNTVTFC